MAVSRRNIKQPLTAKQRAARSQRRREVAAGVGYAAGVAAVYGGVGYYYYRSFTTQSQREFHRTQMKSFVRSLGRANTYRIANARFRSQAQRGAFKVSSRVMRPFSPQAKFNRYYSRRTQKQMFGMRVTAARMRMSNARSYKNYASGRFGNMTNAPRRGRVRRDYKGRFAGWS